jgi:hypothetical protein
MPSPFTAILPLSGQTYWRSAMSAIRLIPRPSAVVLAIAKGGAAAAATSAVN